MNTLNDFFSKIYCINLDSRPDRYKDCLTEFQKLNINVERVSGINGSSVAHLNNKSINAGAFGLLLTHMQLVKEAIAKKYSNFLILEDDIMFIDEFYEKFYTKISSLPKDWDLFYLGGNNMFNKGTFKPITGDVNFVITKNNYKTLKNELCKTTWTQTTHAVAVNQKFYETLLKALNDVNWTVDGIYCTLQQRGCNAYTFLPSIALQRPSFSDIEHQFVDYNHWNNPDACNF